MKFVLIFVVFRFMQVNLSTIFGGPFITLTSELIDYCKIRIILCNFKVVELFLFVVIVVHASLCQVCADVFVH